MSQQERVQVGDSVEILRPPYLEGKIGLIQGRENVGFGQTSDRWLAQVIPDTASCTTIWHNSESL